MKNEFDPMVLDLREKKSLLNNQLQKTSAASLVTVYICSFYQTNIFSEKYLQSGKMLTLVVRENIIKLPLQGAKTK